MIWFRFVFIPFLLFNTLFIQPRGLLTPKQVSANEIIEAVNVMRAQYGLAPYQVDASLMAIAQAQSEYQASITTTTHTRPDGSNADTLVSSENIQPGIASWPASTIVQKMTYDYPHTITLIGFKTGRVGAGAAAGSDGVIYYTLDVINTGGALTGLTANSSATGLTTMPSKNSDATVEVPKIYSVLTSTPLPDGSIYHIVNSGQTLIGIAKAYNLELSSLTGLNRMDVSSVIYPGQRLLVHPSSTPTEAYTATPTALVEMITPTPSPSVISSPTPSLSPTSKPGGLFPQTALAPNVPGFVFILCALALGGLALVGWSKRMSKK